MAKYLDMGPAVLTCCSQAKTPGKPKPEEKEDEKAEN